MLSIVNKSHLTILENNQNKLIMYVGTKTTLNNFFLSFKVPRKYQIYIYP